MHTVTHHTYDNFLQNDKIEGILSLIKDTNDRKIQFDYDNSNIPPSIKEVIDSVNRRTGMNYNYAVLRKFTNTEYSGSYIKHVDPVVLQNTPLFMHTLEGNANLTIWDKNDNKIVIPTMKDRAVIISQDLEHKISPPTNNSGIRYLLFLGLINGVNPTFSNQ